LPTSALFSLFYPFFFQAPPHKSFFPDGPAATEKNCSNRGRLHRLPSIAKADKSKAGTSLRISLVSVRKDNYGLLVRWLLPQCARTHLVPYCRSKRKTSVTEDYKKRLAPTFLDLEHSKFPNDGHELEVQNMTSCQPAPLSRRMTQDVAAS